MSDNTKLIFAAVALYLIWTQSKRTGGAFLGTFQQKPMEQKTT